VTKTINYSRTRKSEINEDGVINIKDSRQTQEDR